MIVKNKLGILMAEKKHQDGRDSATYRAINAATGISTATLSRWVNQTAQSYDRDHIAKLCQFFNCSIDDLLVLEDE